MSQAHFRLFYSTRCSSCTRLISSINKLPTVKSHTEFIDVDNLSPDQFARLEGQLTAVPTLVSNDGKVYVGTATFRFLEQFQGERELDSYDLLGTSGRLAFSEVESENGIYAGFAQFSETFSAFENVD